MDEVVNVLAVANVALVSYLCLEICNSKMKEYEYHPFKLIKYFFSNLGWLTLGWAVVFTMALPAFIFRRMLGWNPMK